MKLSPDYAFPTVQNHTLNGYYDVICLEILNYISHPV
jgi:hypothetical protein